MMSRIPELFTDIDIDDIRQEILLAELDTSAEFRVHIEENHTGDCEARAAELFLKLQMDHTEEHNGILIYLALKNRRFCIYYDDGIRTKIPKDFWVMINQKFLNQISNQNYVDGIIEVIHQTGIHLKKLFPRKPGDVNELSDKITFS
ncbi:MAG TPA: TPM domain-containing protein [Bacteroidales bacterium]|nr:TPM domain-containing protein [Bacteroidales bacterium]